MKWIVSYCLIFFSVLLSKAQVIKFQSAGFGGTTLNAAGTTTKHSMAIGGIVSQAAGQSNRAGFFQGNPDYRPAAQATGVTFSLLAPTSLTITWANGNGTRRLVVVKASSAVTATLASGTLYSVNSIFGSGGTEIGASSGNFAVYDGTGTSVTITNLNPSVIYHIKVFEYNGKYGSNNANIEYQPGAGTGNPGNRTTLASPAGTPASGLSFSNVTKDQMKATWSNGNGTNRIVVVKQGSAVSQSPVNGQGYSSNSVFATGEDLGSANYLVFDGSGSEVTVTGLLPNTVYHYQVVEYNGSGADNNFYLTSAPIANQLTLTEEPVAAAGTAMTQNSFSANWQSVGGAINYYIDVSEDAGFASFVPSYQNKVISGGSSITTPISSLNPGTTYFFRMRAENGAGQSANSSAIAVLTVPATPAIQTSTDILTTSFTANWSSSASATDYFLDVATDAAFSQFVTDLMMPKLPTHPSM